MSDRDKEAYYDSYAGFATRLRYWFIAFGVGAPTLILTQEHVWDELTYSTVKVLVSLFFAGIGLQIFYAIVHKWSQWKLYKCEHTDDPDRDKDTHERGKRYCVAKWADSAYVIDWVADLGTLFLFALATTLLLSAIPNDADTPSESLTEEMRDN